MSNIKSDGKVLERLVAFVEELTVHSGCTVECNERIYKDGHQIAEFDIVVRGKIGTGSFTWLIECRDRADPAPNSWLEQLDGRARRHRFSRVTAVSTSGFAPGVVEFATGVGIDTRDVSSLDPANFKPWLQIESIGQKSSFLLSSDFMVNYASPPFIKDALTSMLPEIKPATPIMRTAKGLLSVDDLLLYLLHKHDPSIWESLVIDGAPVKKELFVDLAGQKILINTPAGDCMIDGIRYIVLLKRSVNSISLEEVAEYRELQTGKTISKISTYKTKGLLGGDMAIDIHDVAGADKIRMVVTRVQDVRPDSLTPTDFFGEGSKT